MARSGTLRKLNYKAVATAMEKNGLNNANLANCVGVTPPMISRYLEGEALPRPKIRLKLCRSLKLKIEELMEPIPDLEEPVIAYRTKRNTKTNEEQKAKARSLGLALGSLVDYLPFPDISQAPTIPNPRIDYDYVQKIVNDVRENKEFLGVGDRPIKLEDFIKLFAQFKVVIIPVFWGNRKGHENALHVYLPKNQVTWIYFNLDSKKIDFRFWMAHELGHLFSPALKDDPEKWEDFAELFAESLLFPTTIAKTAYDDIALKTSQQDRLDVVFHYAKSGEISPLTVIYAIEKYATREGREVLVDIKDKSVHYRMRQVDSSYISMGESIFGESHEERISGEEYISKSIEVFKTPFFETLGKAIRNNGLDDAFIRHTLNINQLDAKGIFQALQVWQKK